MAKKVLGNSVTEFSILELSGAKNPGIFCPLKKKILEFSRIFFLEFHENLVFPENSGPRIFHPAIFCLEIFCPGILFPGKFWHSLQGPSTLTRTLLPYNFLQCLKCQLPLCSTQATHARNLSLGLPFAEKRLAAQK